MNNRHYILFLLCLVTLITIFPFFGTGLTTGDGFNYFLAAKSGNYISHMPIYAEGSGRFYHYLTIPFMFLPYVFKSFFFPFLIHLILLLAGLILVGRLISTVTGSSNAGVLFYLFSITLLQINPYTDPVTSYPIYFSFSFLLVICASYTIVLYDYNQKRKWLLWLGGFMFFLALCFYELYLVYLVVIVGLAHFYNSQKGNIRSIIHMSFPFLLFTFIYLGLYFIYRLFYPSGYSGSIFIDKFDINKIYVTLKSLASLAYPLSVFENYKHIFADKSDLILGHRQNVLYILQNARIEWLVKAIVVFFVTFILLKVRLFKSFPWFMYLLALALSFLLIYLPQLPLAITEKYTYYSEQGLNQYLTTYFSFFGVIIGLVTLTHIILSIVDRIKSVKLTLVLIFSLLMLIGSILNDYANHHIIIDLKQSELRFKMINAFINGKEYKELPEKAVIYLPYIYENKAIGTVDLRDPNRRWSDYFALMGRPDLELCITAECLQQYADFEPEFVFYLFYNQARKTEDQFMVLANIKNFKDVVEGGHDILSDSAHVFYYSTYKSFSLGFESQSSIPYSITIDRFTFENDKRHNVYNIIYYRNPGELAKIDIGCNDLNVNSVYISNILARFKPEIDMW